MLDITSVDILASAGLQIGTPFAMVDEIYDNYAREIVDGLLLSQPVGTSVKLMYDRELNGRKVKQVRVVQFDNGAKKTQMYSLIFCTLRSRTIGEEDDLVMVLQSDRILRKATGTRAFVGRGWATFSSLAAVAEFLERTRSMGAISGVVKVRMDLLQTYPIPTTPKRALFTEKIAAWVVLTVAIKIAARVYRVASPLGVVRPGYAGLVDTAQDFRIRAQNRVDSAQAAIVQAGY